MNCVLVKISESLLDCINIIKLRADSNGPVFMPNTRTMQQMLRYDFKRYEEDVEDGKSVICPLILHIDRGKLFKFGNGQA